MSKSKRKTYGEIFDSPEAFIRAVETRPIAPKWRKHTCLSKATEPKYTEFTGTKSIEEAIHLARYGWPEGRKYMSEAMAEISSIASMSAIPATQMDVAGQYPVAALAAAGDPECMVTPMPVEDRVKSTVKMLVNIALPGSTKEKNINNCGGAICTVIDNLETQGHRVELTLIDNIQTNDKIGDFFAPGLIAKQASEALDINTIAFWLSHPSALRRLMFRAIEWDDARICLYRSYGAVRPVCLSDFPDYDLVIDNLTLTGRCTSPQSAIDAVTEEINAQKDKHDKTKEAA